MKFTKPTVKLTEDQLQDYMTKAWTTCWQTVLEEKAKPDSWFQDYVTASDIETAVRWLIDRDQDVWNMSATWWGYTGWHRIKIAESRYKTSLLDRCREFLADLLRAGTIEGHNFGRGHCSGMRFRAKGTGLNAAEVRTLSSKAKEKPIHLEHSDGGPACTAGRRNNRWRYRFNPKGPRTVSKHEQVTCQRCLNLLKKAGE